MNVRVFEKGGINQKGAHTETKRETTHTHRERNGRERE
jgi:hypothetical protein